MGLHFSVSVTTDLDPESPPITISRAFSAVSSDVQGMESGTFDVAGGGTKTITFGLAHAHWLMFINLGEVADAAALTVFSVQNTSSHVLCTPGTGEVCLLRIASDTGFKATNVGGNTARFQYFVFGEMS